MKRLAGFLFLALLLATAVAVSAIRNSISHGIDEVSSVAIAQYPGATIDALISYVGCDSCPLSERNRAVWALGQLRVRRAVPVLEKFQTGKACDHARGLCQYEIGKALHAIQDRHLVWLGASRRPEL